MRAVTFARALARRQRHAISFAVHGHKDLLASTCEGVRTLSVPKKKGVFQKLYSSWRRRVSTIPSAYVHFDRLGQFDVVACFGVHSPSANVMAAARRSKTRTVLFLTSNEDVRRNATNSARERRNEQHHQYAIRHADAIVAQTEFQRAALRDRFGRDSSLIRNPIDSGLRSTAKKRSRHVLWLGRADRDSKRADVCAKIARGCPEIPFCVVMNDGPMALFDELAAAMPSNVTLLRHVAFNDVEQLFVDAVALLNTSDAEGFPNTFLQAAKYGVPIVSLRVDPDGMLTRHGCGVVAGDEASMVGHVERLWQHRDLATARSPGPAYVRAYHLVEQRAAELEQLLESTLLRTRAA